MRLSFRERVYEFEAGPSIKRARHLPLDRGPVLLLILSTRWIAGASLLVSHSTCGVI